MLRWFTVMDTAKQLKYGDYYLQIQALSEARDLDGVIETRDDVSTTPGISAVTVAVIVSLVLILMAVAADVHYKTFSFIKSSVKLIILIVAIPLGLLLISNPLNWGSKASPDQVPIRVVVDGVNTDSFRISWETQTETVSLIRYWPDDNQGLSQVIMVNLTPNRYHQIVVGGLLPNTGYKVQIMSEHVWYDNQGVPIEVVTNKGESSR